jgi:hypothetical protein
MDALAENGTEVQVEGIMRRHDGLSEWEAERLAEAARWPDLETAGAAVSFLRVESQCVRLRLPAGARNVDLSDVELLRRVGWDNFRRLFAPTVGDRRDAKTHPLVRAGIRLHLRHGRTLDRLSSLRRRNRIINRVVIGERNRVAFAGALDALTRGDVALVWGTDHLPGLARLFQAEGYRLRRKDEFAACTI